MLDEVDLKILQFLARKPEASLTEISQSLSVSRPTVRRRLAKMRESGVLRGFRLVVDEEKLGGVKVALLLSSKNPREDSERLLQLEPVEEVFVLEGNPNLLCLATIFEVSSMRRLLEAAMELDPNATMKVVVEHHRFDKTLEKLVAGGVLRLTCETCGQPIRGEPFTYSYNGSKHFFCCPVCRDLYVKRTISQASSGNCDVCLGKQRGNTV